MNSIQAIQKQIDAASPILERIATLTPAPDRSYLVSGSQSTGKKRYDKVIVVQIEEQINRWQYATKAVLARCFSAGSDHYREFEHTIVEHRDFNLDAKQDLASEVNNGRNILSAIIEAESLIGEIETTTSSNSKKQKKPLVFISHSGKQELFVSAIVALLEHCGFTKDNLFCSSVPGFNIGLDEDIIETLRKEFLDFNIYVVYVFSNELFDSPYCLNEMGAAWVLQVDNSIIITRDMDERKIDGVVNKGKTRISFKDSDLQLESRMIELREKLTDFVGLPKVKEIDWRRYYVEFIQKLKDGIQQKVKTPAQKPSKPAFTYTTASPDDIISTAINKLGEFTLGDLQKETQIENRTFLMQKINAMLSAGTLEAVGPVAHRKYKLVIVSNQLF